jgi:multidrug transporter EmrE-like cation transporter
MSANAQAGPETGKISRLAYGGLLGYTIMNLCAAFCFKECAADQAHTWLYFAAGNVFGPVSLIFLMWVYAELKANMAAALCMGAGAISTQVAFWAVYQTQLAPWQWLGVGLAIGGGILLIFGKPPTPLAVRPAPEKAMERLS